MASSVVKGLTQLTAYVTARRGGHTFKRGKHPCNNSLKKKGVDLFLRVGLFLVHTDLELGNTGNLTSVMCQFPAAFLL